MLDGLVLGRDEGKLDMLGLVEGWLDDEGKLDMLGLIEGCLDGIIDTLGFADGREEGCDEGCLVGLVDKLGAVEGDF